MGDVWSLKEVRLIVKDYFDMLTSELKGEKYNKRAHAQKLAPLLNNRSRGAIEFKHANISAALDEKGIPYIDGYKPRGNYQDLISQVIDEYLQSNSFFTDILNTYISEQSKSYTVHANSLLELLEEAPTLHQDIKERIKRKVNYIRNHDFAEKEKLNTKIGQAGEELIIMFETERLTRLKKPELAAKIEWVSKDIGDGLGYDIKSFNEDGSVRYIEVKTTNLGKKAPFYFTINELLFSEKYSENYYLYRVFNFSKDKKLFIILGALSSICKYSPTEFKGYL